MGMWGKRDDMVVHQQEPFNAEPPGGALAGARITDVDTFYSRSHGPVPRLDPADWRLTVDGLVAHPLRLSLAELRDRFEETGATVTLQCAGNRRAGLMTVRDIPGETPWGRAPRPPPGSTACASPTSSPTPVSRRRRPTSPSTPPTSPRPPTRPSRTTCPSRARGRRSRTCCWPGR